MSAKPIKPMTAWAAVRGDVIISVDGVGRTKKGYTDHYFNGQFEKSFKAHGWRVVRVRVEAEAAIQAVGCLRVTPGSPEDKQEIEEAVQAYFKARDKRIQLTEGGA